MWLYAGAIVEEWLFNGLTLKDARVGRHIVGEPHVAAHHGVMTDAHAPQDGGVGIHRYVVFQDGVAWHVDGYALLVVGEIFGT